MNYYSQETERLILRKLTEDDIETWAEFFVDNPGVRFVGIELSQDKMMLSKNWMERQLARYTNNQLGHLAAVEKLTGQFVGQGGILIRDFDGQTEYEIGYSILPKFWGKGYATEIAMQMKRFGLENEISQNFISIIHKDNEASMKVAVKNGMTKLRESAYLGMDVFVFGD